jgi:hypothetical protein
MAMRLGSSDMLRSRLGLAGIIAAVLLASCGSRPGVTVSIAGEPVTMLLSSATERTACSSQHGDAFPRELPLTVVRTAAPVTLRLEAGQGVTHMRGWIYDVDAPTPSGGPIEEFTLSGRSGTYQTRSIAAARTYSVLVNVVWSFLVTGGEETHAFRMRVEPP